RVELLAGAERDAGVVDGDLVTRRCLVAVADDDVLDAEVERDVAFGLLDGGALERHGGTLATMWSNTHTGATWFRRGRSIRMSCKPRSPVGLVNPPAKRKCEERSRTRRLGRPSRRRRPGLGPWPGGGANQRARRGGRADRPKRDTEGSASASVGRLHPGRRANRKGSLSL